MSLRDKVNVAKLKTMSQLDIFSLKYLDVIAEGGKLQLCADGDKLREAFKRSCKYLN